MHGIADTHIRSSHEKSLNYLLRHFIMWSPKVAKDERWKPTNFDQDNMDGNTELLAGKMIWQA